MAHIVHLENYGRHLGSNESIFGHHEKYRFTLEVPIETHAQAGVSIGQWSWQGRFFVVPFLIFYR